MRLELYLYCLSLKDTQLLCNPKKRRQIKVDKHFTKYVISTPQNCQSYPKQILKNFHSLQETEGHEN